MKSYIQRNFKRFQPLLNELVARDVKIKYRRCCFRRFMDIIKSTFYDDYFVSGVFKLV